MNIIIKTEEKDAVLLEGFAASTGWTEKTGKTLEEWIQQKVGEYISREARSGFVRAAGDATRAVYVAAVQAATLASRTAIQPPVVSAELAWAKSA